MNTTACSPERRFWLGAVAHTGAVLQQRVCLHGVEGWCTPSSFREILADSVALADAGQLEAMFFFVRLPSSASAHTV